MENPDILNMVEQKKTKHGKINIYARARRRQSYLRYVWSNEDEIEFLK